MDLWREQVSIHGMMDDVTPANGKTTKCMVKEFSHGQMEINMMAGTRMIKDMGREVFNGMMDELT